MGCYATRDPSAVAALPDDAHVGAALDLQRGRDAGGDRGGVAEQRVDPRQLPGALGVGGGEDLQAPGRVGGDDLAAGGAEWKERAVSEAESVPLDGLADRVVNWLKA